MTRIRKSTQRKPTRSLGQGKVSAASYPYRDLCQEEGVFPAEETSADDGNGADRVAGGVLDETKDVDVDLDDLEFDPNARDILGDFGLDDEEAVPEESDFWFDADDEFED